MNYFLNEIWSDLLKEELNSDIFKEILKKVEQDSQQFTIYPPRKNLFNAFNFCDLNKLSVVIIGQDPYHGEKQANGLAFSVNEGVPLPPSLKNILKEVKQNYGTTIVQNGDLKAWAQQGVLLLNSVLTVRAGQPGSHADFGWQLFTDTVIRKISKIKQNLIFMLWGNYAKNKSLLINGNHFILTAPHPSPFSAHSGFLGCEHFKKANQFLQSLGKEPIKW